MATSWIRAPLVAALGASLLLWTALLSLAAIVASIGDRAGGRANAVQIFYSRFLLRMCGVRLLVTGRSRLPKGTLVLMANHRSHLDVPALIAALPELRLRWVAKKELGRIPIFGWGLHAVGHVLVDRKNRARAIETLERAERELDRGMAVVVFPEGTRSLDARLLPFKRGGFHLAMRGGFPIVPVAVQGSEAILPKRSMVIKPGVIRVEVLEPIETRGRAGSELADLVSAVRGRLESALDRPSPAAPL